MSRPGIKPRPPAMQAGTLSKSYLDSLQIGQFWSAAWQPHCMELILRINSGDQMIASRSPLIIWMQADQPRHLQSAFLNHVRVTTMEEPDQTSLHLQIKHPKHTLVSVGHWSPATWATGGHSNNELSRQRTHRTFLIGYILFIYFCLLKLYLLNFCLGQSCFILSPSRSCLLK